jgi:hypothetical protein
LQQQNVEDKVVSGYQSWKICPDTGAGRYVWIPDLKDMSEYQSNSTRAGAAEHFVC